MSKSIQLPAAVFNAQATYPQKFPGHDFTDLSSRQVTTGIECVIITSQLGTLAYTPAEFNDRFNNLANFWNN